MSFGTQLNEQLGVGQEGGAVAWLSSEFLAAIVINRRAKERAMLDRDSMIATLPTQPGAADMRGIFFAHGRRTLVVPVTYPFVRVRPPPERASEQPLHYDQS